MENRTSHRNRALCGKELQEVSGSKAGWEEPQNLAKEEQLRELKIFSGEVRLTRNMTAVFTRMTSCQVEAGSDSFCWAFRSQHDPLQHILTHLD